MQLDVSIILKQDALADEVPETPHDSPYTYAGFYVFLAPSDYDVSFVDIVMPLTAQVTLDGAPLAVAPTALSSGYGVARVPLSLGNNGAHLLEASEPVGIQVVGYGRYTSYQYPGGLNLRAIAPPPPPPN